MSARLGDLLEILFAPFQALARGRAGTGFGRLAVIVGTALWLVIGAVLWAVTRDA